ncbi:hypothetical protein LZ575_06780 [Antarcticibacterium sp. 1MA-6-2]|uniref:DUF6929 family protein n=1 Tax=Antarcticibacterium sp. 1MA-6-2 TaxID=2908210 RepID=UPI001F2C816B|nr:hypothetical protein [Antarcticibacterium sp. 1MA-6-2]UJH92256.1 hypothetical protein LZ575_06780 [Antarcticibacterium sp. 1MA-6-2]
MRNAGSVLWIMILILMSNCKPTNVEFKLLEINELNEIPSASGIEETRNGRYIIGDNSPWLFKLNKNNEVIDRISLLPERTLPDSIFEKLVKPDFEAMTKVDPEGNVLLIFGSGSKSPERDVLVEVNLSSEEIVPKEFSITEIYDGLRAAAEIPSEHLNIEAAEVVEDDLYLFNRGKNLIAKYSLSTFRRYLEEKGEVPLPEIIRFKLPEIQGIESGFSGASYIEGAEIIVFTATVENTANWIDDGEVLGSFIGAFKINDLSVNNTPASALIQQGGKSLMIKVESVTVLSEKEGEAELLLVTDSDGGVSEILRGTLTYSE